ncbi:DUF3052 domain-containing protein [Mucilaginibacter sp.]|uniref:DUF3052 domain-containing protein n=1 Tax=Mucilaginibacter sp. TaxID=1882438 RepID=UPI002609B831|nr:DUF3052 domain-containing protein [Mucilaginibacter sp.]
MGDKIITQPTGYSGTPLAKKLGIKPAFNMMLINAPAYYFDLFTDLPADVQINDDVIDKKDLIHFFTKQKDDYISILPGLKDQIKPNGIIWISWPKKASKIVTDITEDIIRNYAIQTGLVDIKVCAVDEIWSGLKLVIPVKDRG